MSVIRLGHNQFKKRTMGLSAACLVLFHVAGLVGCQNETTVAKSPRTPASSDQSAEPTGSNASTVLPNQDAESEPANSKGVLGKASELLDKAKSSGGGATNWVKDRLGDAANAGSTTAQDTLDWANQTYQSLKKQGLTKAGSTSEWVSEDWNKMGAWEYKVEQINADPERAEKRLNELGADRWECFHVANSPEQGAIYYFKKPARSYLKNIPFKDMMRLVPLLDNGQ